MTIVSKDKKFKIGTRKSPLALKQVEEIARALKVFYPVLEYVIVGIDTCGDKDKKTPISQVEGSDFFTRQIETALLEGRIDFAVHSAKDLPDESPKGLAVAAVTKSLDPFDALVSKNNLRIEQLSSGAKIGASSGRRKIQLKKYRDDFCVVDVRGNIGERLEKLNELDAVVVAACALVRLGLGSRIAQRIPFDILTPHPLQGCLAIETRSDNKELMDSLKVLNGR